MNVNREYCSPSKKGRHTSVSSGDLSEHPILFSKEYGSKALNLLNKVLFNYCQITPEIHAPDANNFNEIYAVNPALQRLFKLDDEHCSLTYDTTAVKNSILRLKDVLLDKPRDWPPFIWINLQGPYVSILFPSDNLTLKNTSRGNIAFQLLGLINNTGFGYEVIVRTKCGGFNNLESIQTTAGAELVRMFSSGTVVSILYGIENYSVLLEVPQEGTPIVTLTAAEILALRKLRKKTIFPLIKDEKRFMYKKPDVLSEEQKKASELLKVPTRNKFELTEKESNLLATLLDDTPGITLSYRNFKFYGASSTGALCPVCLRRSYNDVSSVHCLEHTPDGDSDVFTVYLKRAIYNLALSTPRLDLTSQFTNKIRPIYTGKTNILSNNFTLQTEVVSTHTRTFNSLLKACSYLRALTVCNVLHASLSGHQLTRVVQLGPHNNGFSFNALNEICKKFKIRIQLGQFERPQKMSEEMTIKYGIFFPNPGTYDKFPLVYTRFQEIDATKNVVYVGKQSTPQASVTGELKYYEPGRTIHTSAVVLTPSRWLLPSLESATQVAYILAMYFGLKKLDRQFVFQNFNLEVVTEVMKDTKYVEYVKLIFLQEFNYNIIIEQQK